MKNRMSDLTNHLFAQIERLGEEDLDLDAIDRETRRAEALVRVADRIVDVQRLNLSAARLYAEHGAAVLPLLPQIGAALPPARQPAGDGGGE